MRYFELNEKSLDKEEALKSRAEAQGFNTSKVWYHGTQKKFSQFKIGKGGVDELGQGIYFTGDRDVADSWAREDWSDGKGRIIACYLRRGEYFDLSRFRTDKQLSKAWNDKRWAAIVDELHPKHSAYMENLFGPNSAYDRNGFNDMLVRNGVGGLLGKLGYIGAYDHQSQIHDQIVIFNVKDARRIDAKFHPDKADSSRLLDSEDLTVR